ncbi:MAG: flagellar biosynthetic protein FliR [Patescibacteria group bacterium]|nr:flagellar biosynthetic protein FliR [Patescibacteria group bacterium]
MLWLQWLGIEKFLLFTLVLTRVSGVIMTAPVFGGSEVPIRIRALFSLSIAMLILPTQWHVSVEYPGTMLNYVVYLAAELMVGLCLGLGVTILFTGLQVAGALIGQLGGMMMADVFDPTTQSNVSAFSKLLFMIGLAVFVGMGGHRIVMGAVLDTFTALPPGGGSIPDSLTGAFVTLITQSFLLGLRAAMPMTAALLLSTLILGLIGRTMPQLNVLVLGFGLNSMLTFALMAFSLGAAIWIFQDQLEPAIGIVIDAVSDGWQTG